MARREALEAFSQGFRETIHPTPFGERSGDFIVQMRISEALVHGWDLARATGQPADLPEDLAERALGLWRTRLENRPRQGGPVGVEQEAPAAAPASDRLAAFLGRPL